MRVLLLALLLAAPLRAGHDVTQLEQNLLAGLRSLCEQGRDDPPFRNWRENGGMLIYQLNLQTVFTEAEAMAALLRREDVLARRTVAQTIEEIQENLEIWMDRSDGLRSPAWSDTERWQYELAHLLVLEERLMAPHQHGRTRLARDFCATQGTRIQQLTQHMGDF